MAWAATDASHACRAEAAANKYIQDRFVPKLVAAGIVVCVDIVRRPDEESPQGAAIVKKADEIDAATIVLCPHAQDFTEVRQPDAAMLAERDYVPLRAALLTAVILQRADAVRAAEFSLPYVAQLPVLQVTAIVSKVMRLRPLPSSEHRRQERMLLKRIRHAQACHSAALRGSQAASAPCIGHCLQPARKHVLLPFWREWEDHACSTQ